MIFCFTWMIFGSVFGFGGVTNTLPILEEFLDHERIRLMCMQFCGQKKTPLYTNKMRQTAAWTSKLLKFDMFPTEKIHPDHEVRWGFQVV